MRFEAGFSPTETILLFSSLSVEDDDKPHPGLRSTGAGPAGADGKRGAGFYFEHNRCLGAPPKEPDLDVVSWFAIHPHRDDGFMAYARKDCKGISEGPNKMDMCGVCDADAAISVRQRGWQRRRRVSGEGCAAESCIAAPTCRREPDRLTRHRRTAGLLTANNSGAGSQPCEWLGSAATRGEEL